MAIFPFQGEFLLEQNYGFFEYQVQAADDQAKLR